MTESEDRAILKQNSQQQYFMQVYGVERLQEPKKEVLEEEEEAAVSQEQVLPSCE